MDNQELETQIGKNSSDINSIRTDMSSMRTDMVSMRTDMVSMRTDIDAVRSDIDALRTDIDALRTDIDALRRAFGNVIALLQRVSEAVDEGFNRVNERLAILEGKEGMQGVTHQLSEIKTELHKIQKTFPYEDLYANLKTIHAEA